jgi:catalase
LPIPEYPLSPALSLLHRPGETGVSTRRVAILVAPGVDAATVRDIYATLLAAGAVPRLVGSRLGKVAGIDGDALDVEITLETSPSVLYDAVVIPGGDEAVAVLRADAHALDFVRQQYRHCKPILALDGGANLLESADVPPTLPDGSADPALVSANAKGLKKAVSAFIEALAAHRNYARENDPPKV